MRANLHRSTDDVRPAAVAGTFYPHDPGDLRTMVEHFLAEAADHGPPTKAYVLPHAGYVYSGAVAATGYRLLQSGHGQVQRIVLAGPSHHLAFQGIAVSDHEGYRTPLGIVPVDRTALGAIRRLPQVVVLNAAHASEHSIEVHLPFLQVALDSFEVVPLVVGESSEEEVAAVLENLWAGPETHIVVSSDLSHYHEYSVARGLDRETARSIEALRPVRIDQACGAIPLNGLLRAVRNRGLRARTLDLRNSGDTAGPRDRVVGYGAFALG